MSSRRSVGGGEELHQSSLFRYTKSKPRKSVPAPPPRKASSSSRGQTSPAANTGDLTKLGGTRLHESSSSHSITPSQTSIFGGSSSGPSREIKENKAPNTGDQRIIQREEAKTVELDREDAGIQVPTPGLSKRKNREWEVEQHPGRVGSEPIKRRRLTSSTSSPPHNQASRNIKEEIASPIIQHDPQSKPTETPDGWSSVASHLQNHDDDIDCGPGAVIESSQTQPLLSPERPLASSLQAHASSSQISDGGIVRSSQSPSPLKYSRLPTEVGEDITFVATPLQISIHSSPSKMGHGATEAPAVRRRRVPEPGTVSLFGVRGAGVRSPPEVSLDIGSPSTRALHSGVKLIRRPGRYSILPLVADKGPETSQNALNINQIHYFPARAQTKSVSVSSVVLADQVSSQTSLELGGGSKNRGKVKNEAIEPGPFWETQPLLDFDSDESLSPSTSPPVSPSPLPRMHLPPTSASGGTIHTEMANMSGSETEPDSPTPFLPSTRYNASHADPDQTVVTFTPTRGAALGPVISSNREIRHLDVGGSVLVVNSDSPTASAEGEEEDGDKTMVNHHGRALGDSVFSTGEVKEGDIRDLTLGVEGLSPFKGEKPHPVAPKHILRLHESEAIVIDDDEEDDDARHLAPAVHHAAPEETQGDQTYTQLWPGTSLPAGWNTFETPKKPRRQLRMRLLDGSRPNSFRGGITFLGGGDDDKDLLRDGYNSDDVFGPEVTPRTLQREKPDEVKGFEAMPSPYIGMFNGHVEGESETDSDV